MHKKILCLLLILSCLFLGGQFPVKAEELANKKILIIGNSHSADAFYLLQLAFREQHPDEKLTLGVLSYSGCSIDQHLQFAQANAPVYRYYKNTDVKWSIQNKQTMESVLHDQAWDMILLQAAKSDLDNTLNVDGRRALEAYVNRHLANDHVFMWHTSWPSPNDDAFFGPDAARPAPEGYKENLVKLYGFDPLNQYTVLATKATTHILPDPVYDKALCTGAAMMHAYLVSDLPQTALWRDYTHLNDFGRLTVAYALLAQLEEKPIKSISLDTVPAELRHEMFSAEGPLVLTDEMRQTIVSAANYALISRFAIPHP